MKIKVIIAVSILFLLTTFCKSKTVSIERAFYYWKNSEYSLGENESDFIKDNNVQKLYVKFFEVDSDPVLRFIPIAKTQLHIWENTFPQHEDNLTRNKIAAPEVVPTVFIKNKALAGASKGSLDTLADNMSFLVNKIFKENIRYTSFGYREIQLDCDLTEKTRENYFYLISRLKTVSGKSVSCTLRLYPYKYRSKMGVPPADRVVLMCYNLVNPVTNEDINSILSKEELKKYLSKAKPYPVHVDIALPVFSWMQVYQNGHFAGIINPRGYEMEDALRPLKPMWFEVVKDTELDNIYLRAGDKIKSEDVSAGEIKDAISLIKKYVQLDEQTTVVFFHLDGSNLNKFDDETVDSFYTDFIK